MTPERRKSFWALIVTQFFGAFNDNLLKILVSLLIVDLIADPYRRNTLVSMTGNAFVAPFLIFSMIAGRLSDRMSKSKVIFGVQVWQLLVVGVATLSLLQKNIPFMMVSIFLLSMQAAFFSPAKYGILPELMDDRELSYGNGLLNMGTFVAILVGTIAGSLLSEKLPVACGLLIVCSIGGLIGSRFIGDIPAAKPDEEWAWNPLLDLWKNWKLITQDRALKLGIAAVNYFWFMGAMLQLNVFLYTKAMMNDVPVPALLQSLVDKVGHTPFISGALLASVTVGIAIGSYLAGRFSRGKVELGLVPLGALGMSLFAIDLGWAYHSLPRALFDFFMLGLSGGFYEIPLNSLIQWRSPPGERGRVLATQNFISFTAILFASAALWLLGSVFKLNPAEVLLTLGILSLLGTAAIYFFLPDAVWRLVLYTLTNILYRIKVVGGERVPSKGPALLIANHLSLADGFLVGGAVPRLIRFLMWRPYYEMKPWHSLLRTMKAIPISEKDPPKEILRSLMKARQALEEGHLVCIFAEGQVSRTGNLLEFKKGFEIIVKGLDVSVIPVHLDRVWGSIFSFEHGKAIFKKPRQIPYPVTITFGEPLKVPISSPQARQAILDLGVQAFAGRLDEKGPLAVEFIKRAKKQPRELAVADSMGKELSFAELAAVSAVFSKHLDKILPPEMNVGLLLPSSVGGAIANVALGFSGRVPVNLNYTSGAAALQVAVDKAKITRIFTSRKLLEKTGLPTLSSMVFLEDLIPQLSRFAIVKERILFAVLPLKPLIRRFAGKAPTSLDAIATIIFSSGSTGVPKGIVLSHKNILSNILGLSQVFDVGEKDRIIGVLPFFHAFGFTATLWFPLIGGFTAVYHVNPLDAKTVGELAQKYKATLLVATPTFLLAYTRKCTGEQFATMRYVITGAERLRDSIAAAFEEKFGKVPLEGYGCTELSPVATVNVPNISMGEISQVGRKAGMIGHPIPGVSVRIANPDTLEPLPQGEKGVLLVKGLNVMQGYLDEPEKTREVIHDGWYVTGDIAMVDNDGFVRIVDRLSRFSKIGGEMVPHVLIEEKLQQLAGRTETAFVVTGVPDERRGEQLVVLYLASAGLSIDALFAAAQASDLPKLWIPAKENFFKIDAIPYLGTGKLDLTALRTLATTKIGKDCTNIDNLL
jgi:acyl-[acyl-carrier-protein]-phospholipid O-acyltransferase / long-chain-fatty-acid--[acyl-carrier-protein] ligase